MNRQPQVLRDWNTKGVSTSTIPSTHKHYSKEVIPVNDYDTDPQELAETAEMLDGLVEQPDRWTNPMSDWFRKNILDLLDRTKL